jgi:hypothetical protein
MRNKLFIKGFRQLSLAVLVLALAVSGFAKMYEEPKSFSLKDKSQEQFEHKILPKIDTERLLAKDRTRGKDMQRPCPQHFAVAADVAFTLSNSGTSNFTALVTDKIGDSRTRESWITIFPTTGDHTISGRVDIDFIGLGGVTLTISPGTAVTTDSAGYYSISVSPGWSGTVTPSKLGYTFSPASQSYTDVTSNQTTNYIAFLPDLIVESLTHSPANPTTADQITFTAVVKNVGTASAGASTLMFRIGGETPGAPKTQFSVPALAPGASKTVTRLLTLNVAQNYMNTATADYTSLVAESNETNNTTTDTYAVTQLARVSTISGKVMYNGEPVTNYTNKSVVFWARDEISGQVFPISPTYNSSDGTYSIPNMPTGQYGIQVYIDDAEPFDGKYFPGDYYGWTSPIEVNAPTPVIKDLVCTKLIHLTSPIDNGSPVGPIPPPYNTHTFPVNFQWNAIAEASTYDVKVDLYQDSPYSLLQNLFYKSGITDTQKAIDLPANGTNEHYMLRLYAYNSNSLTVGQLMVVYTNGWGWDYRFKVIALLPDLIVESLTHSPANPTTADQITFTAVVKNVGTASAGASTLMFRIGGETPGAPKTLFPVPDLAPGASKTVTRLLTLKVAQDYMNTAIADYTSLVAESSETNNTAEDRYTVIPAGALSTIFGKIMYNGSSVTGKQKVDFLAIDENSEQSFPISPTYNPPDGTYSIPNMPTGKYGIQIYIDDAPPIGGGYFPGDYYGWTSPINVSAPSPVNVDLVCAKIIHLTSPVNNAAPGLGSLGPPYDTYSNPITFQWDANADAATYIVEVIKQQGNQYGTVFFAFSESGITATQKTISLPLSGTDEHYYLWLYAFNGNELVGRLIVAGINNGGHRWDYPFRITGAGPASEIIVETKADGTGTVVPALNIAPGSSITVYAISRDAGGNFVENVAAESWSLINKTGGVEDRDLVPAGDMKSAMFTGHLSGSANIHAAKSGLTSHDSGLLAVTPEIYEFVAKWGSYGSGDGQFHHALKIAVDSAGNVYVVDPGNARIQKFRIR